MKTRFQSIEKIAYVIAIFAYLCVFGFCEVKDCIDIFFTLEDSEIDWLLM